MQRRVLESGEQSVQSRDRHGLVRGGAIVATLAASAALLLGVATGAHASSISFGWSGGSSRVVPPGTSSLEVDIVADQEDGADAAGVTLGFETSGIVSDVSLVSVGPLVSEPDSTFNTAAGTTFLIATAPSNPGSFGADVDFTVATMEIEMDSSGRGEGALDLLDVTDVAGPPALEADGVSEIPADLGSSFAVTVVPEPGTATLVLGSLAGLGAARRRGR